MTASDASHVPRDGRVKLLFVTHNVPRFSGDAAGSFVLRLAVALQATGAEVQIIAPGAPGLPTDDVLEGVPIRRVRYASGDRMTLAYSGTMAEAVRQSWSARFALLGMLWHMRRAVRRELRDAKRRDEAYDVVHAHWWFPSGLVAWIAGVGSGSAPPLVITMHGSDVRLADSARASHPVMRAVLRRARAVTAVSAWLAEKAKGIVRNIGVYVAPMPVDVELFEPPGEGTERTGVLFVGRLNAQKGLADVLDAFAQLRNKTISLDVIGAGPDEVSLRDAASRLGIETRVRWHGALPHHELVSFYQRARVVAIPSLDEGLGLVAVEAQLCETPVVAYQSGGTIDVVRSGGGSTLVPPSSIKALADAIEHLAMPSHEKAQQVRDAMPAVRAHMLRAFSPASVAARYLQIYASARRPNSGVTSSDVANSGA